MSATSLQASVNFASAIERFDNLKPGVVKAVRTEVTRLSIELQRAVKETKLTGQVLNVRTGTLRRSISRKMIERYGVILGVVGTNVKYGAAHEYGFSGPVTVKAHMRMMKMAWGKEVKQPRLIQVRQHVMNMKLPERSFLRSALDEMRPKIQLYLKLAAEGAVRK